MDWDIEAAQTLLDVLYTFFLLILVNDDVG